MAGQRIGAAIPWLLSRVSENASTVYEAASSANASSTLMANDEPKFASAKSIRTSTIILASFNAVAACATACGILYDTYSARRRNRQRFRSRAASTFIQATDIYPLVLTLGITIQGVGFTIAQAQGLRNLFMSGCAIVAQFVLPAVFLVPFIQLVFSLEVMLRALRRKPFPQRRKYTVTICLVLVGMLVLASFLIADFNRPPDMCLASLFWFIAVYAKGSFAAMLGIDLVLVLSLITLSVRLSHSIEIETSERVAASRMVYYLALAILSNTLILPYFFSQGIALKTTSDSQTFDWSMVASVVANVSGLTTGGLHLFLRSSVISLIGPRDKMGEYDRQRIKNQIRRYNERDPNFAGHVLEPVERAVDLRRILSDAGSISGGCEDKDEESGVRIGRQPRVATSFTPQPNPLRSNAFVASSFTMTPAMATLVAATTATAGAAAAGATVCVPEQAGGLQRPRPSATQRLVSVLSMAPAARVSAAASDEKPLLLLPATTYSPPIARAAATTQGSSRFDFGSLKPPPSMSSLIARRHRRNSSQVSTATVQIGLRLSNIRDICMTPLEAQTLDRKVYTLDDTSGEMTAMEESQSTTVRLSDSAATVPVMLSSPAAIHIIPRQPSPTKARQPSPCGVGCATPQPRSNTPAEQNRGDWI